MTELRALVKLDEAGHVCGVTRARAAYGDWISAPTGVARDPFAHRLCPENGWVCKTEQECAEFDERHALPEPEADPRLVELRAKRDAGTLTSDDVLDAVGLLLDRV